MPRSSNSATLRFGTAASGTDSASVSRFRSPSRSLLTDPDARVQAAAAVAYGKIGQPIPVSSHAPGRASVLRPALRPAEDEQRQGPVPPPRGGDGSRPRGSQPASICGTSGRSAKEKYDSPPVRMGVLLALRKHEQRQGRGVPHRRRAADRRGGGAGDLRRPHDERVPGAGEARGHAGPAGRGRVPRAGRELLARHARGRGARRPVRRPRGRTGLHPRLRPQAARATGPKPPRATRSPASRWTSPSATRTVAADALKAVGVGIFAGSDVVRREAAQVAAKLGIKEFGPAMAALVKDATQPDEPSRRSALRGRCSQRPGRRRSWPRSRSGPTSRSSAPPAARCRRGSNPPSC